MRDTFNESLLGANSWDWLYLHETTTPEGSEIALELMTDQGVRAACIVLDMAHVKRLRLALARFERKVAKS